MTLRHAPFFLTGAPKSGTTWLGKLLDAHPEISCRGEACVHRFAPFLAQAIRSYNDLLVNRRAIITDSNDFPVIEQAEGMALMRRFIELRLEAIADPAKPALRFLGEKDPEHGFHLPPLNHLFPEGKVVHIIRDPRAVCVSAWHHNVRSNDPRLKTHSQDQLLDITAKIWVDRIRSAQAGGKLLGDRFFELRYEDLVAEPELWTTRVLDFLGAKSDPATVKACVEAASFEKLSQGRKPGEEDKSSFFRKGIPDDWKNELTPAQIQRIVGLTGPLLAELGYGA